MQICVIMVSDIGIWCYNGLDLDLDLDASASAHITFVVMFVVMFPVFGLKICWESYWERSSACYLLTT